MSNDLSNISFFVDKELSKEYIFDKVIENSIEKVMISNKNNVQILEFVYKDGKIADSEEYYYLITDDAGVF